MGLLQIELFLRIILVFQSISHQVILSENHEEGLIRRFTAMAWSTGSLLISAVVTLVCVPRLFCAIPFVKAVTIICSDTPPQRGRFMRCSRDVMHPILWQRRCIKTDTYGSLPERTVTRLIRPEQRHSYLPQVDRPTLPRHFASPLNWSRAYQRSVFSVFSDRKQSRRHLMD